MAVWTGYSHFLNCLLQIATGNENKQKTLKQPLMANYCYVCLLFVLVIWVFFKFPFRKLMEIVECFHLIFAQLWDWPFVRINHGGWFIWILFTIITVAKAGYCWVWCWYFEETGLLCPQNDQTVKSASLFTKYKPHVCLFTPDKGGKHWLGYLLLSFLGGDLACRDNFCNLSSV